MYNQFCKNLKNFLSIINNEAGIKNSRAKNAEVLLSLTDIQTYNEYKKNQQEEYTRISNLIYDLSQYSNGNPSLKRLVWELWAYGFDVKQAHEPVKRDYDIDEVARFADLIMSTHYFV